jgi:hypothetical protein
MNRLKKCVYIPGKSMIRSSLYFMLIYLLVYAVLLSSAIIFRNEGSKVYFYSGFDVSAAIFVFIYVISSYKEMNNFLLMFGNTRKMVFLSQVAVNTAMCAILALMSLLFVGIDHIVAGVMFPGFKVSPSSVNAIYPYAGIASVFIFVMAFYILLTSFSMVYGTLAYKFGKVFIAAFWICFGLSFAILPIIIDVFGIGKAFINAIEAYLCINLNNGILLASANFIITALLFNAFAYLVSRRQPQAA